MRSTFLALMISTFALAIITVAYSQEMTREQVAHYMKNYDQAYEQNHKLMFDNIEYGLIVGQLALQGADYCREQVKRARDIELSRLNPHDPAFHSELGKVDGKWDGRKEGCSNAMQLMAQRKQMYESELKPRWVNGVALGQKVAALQLELFSASVYELERGCLDPQKVQGIVKFFMADEVSPDEQLSRVQLDCQGQARLVVQVYEQNESQRLARAAERSDYGRRAASVK